MSEVSKPVPNNDITYKKQNGIEQKGVVAEAKVAEEEWILLNPVEPESSSVRAEKKVTFDLNIQDRCYQSNRRCIKKRKDNLSPGVVAAVSRKAPETILEKEKRVEAEAAAKLKAAIAAAIAAAILPVAKAAGEKKTDPQLGVVGRKNKINTKFTNTEIAAEDALQRAAVVLEPAEKCTLNKVLLVEAEAELNDALKELEETIVVLNLIKATEPKLHRKLNSSFIAIEEIKKEVLEKRKKVKEKVKELEAEPTPPGETGSAAGDGYIHL